MLEKRLLVVEEDQTLTRVLADSLRCEGFEVRCVADERLLRDIWGYSDSALTRAVDHAIARLRKKLEDDPSRPRFIQTVHGDGYSLSAP